MREVTIAAVQMKPALGEIEENLVRMTDYITRIASQQKIDLIVFPELVTSGYEMGVRFTEVAQLIPGPTVNLISQRAQQLGVYVAFGMVAKERVESILYDAAVLVGPDGELIGEYRKTHLKGEERMAFREGFRLPVFDTEFGTVGLMLGSDLSYPEVARSQVLEGAEVLCALGSWERGDIDEWQTLLKARAYENACFVAGANRVGEDVTMTFGGESMIVGPRGKVHAHLPGTEKKKEEPKKEADKDAKEGDTAVKEERPRKEKEEIVEGYCVARIDLDEVRKFREQRQTLQTRQPTAYRALVRKY
ncbi:MAG: carbon-nitrogen hydrolase family protein [Anaerolineae bacterium]|nr:carbon-nitrogen hydrolase family protein [Anaerolineae bacterium]